MGESDGGRSDQERRGEREREKEVVLRLSDRGITF